MNKKKLMTMVMALTVSLSAMAQSLQLKLDNVTVKKAMTELKQKSGYSFVYEAADIDGAGGFKKLTAITLPLISPTLFLLIVINIIYGLQVFDSVLIMTNGGPGGATTVFLERIYKYAFKQYKMGLASAYSWILFVLIMIFTAVQFRLQRKWVNYDA